MTPIQPTTSSERLQVIDALRGFALFGILLANLYSFIGYNTYGTNEILNLPITDKAVLFLIDWFVEGKFYGIFSILFGVGFAIQAQRFHSTENSFNTFWFKRMTVLCCIGLAHMFFVWNGDILTLYALLGLLLPLFLHCSNRALLAWIVALLIMPIVMYVLVYMTASGAFWQTMGQISQQLQTQWGFAHLSLLEMRTSSQPIEVFAINALKAIPRPLSYLMTGRYFHVLGLFLIGMLLARYWLPKIHNPKILNQNKSLLKSAFWFGIIGLSFSLLYAISKLTTGSAYQLNTWGIVQVVSYNLGSTTLALSIAAVFIHCWSTGRAQLVFKNLTLLGRMALSNYLLQNVTAVLLFFGYGFALMREVSFVYLPLFALGILVFQWWFSRTWLSRYRQGPIELIWKKLTY